MRPPSLRRMGGGTDREQAGQDAVDQALRDVAKPPFGPGAGALLEGEVFAAGNLTRSIEHKLGRATRGFVVVGNTGPNPADIYQTTPDAGTEKTHIKLVAAADCTVALWVW